MNKINKSKYVYLKLYIKDNVMDISRNNTFYKERFKFKFQKFI